KKGQLPEIAEPVPRPLLNSIGQWGNRLTAVLLEPDLFLGDSPPDIPVAKASARGEEQVHQRQVRLDKPLAHEKRLRRDIGKALVAALWRFRVAELSIVDRPYHLTLAVADGHVLVKRIHDRHVPERVPHLPDHVVPKKQRVLEMNDIRPDGEKELAKVLRVKLLAGYRPVQPVELVSVGVQEVLVGVAVN